MVYRRLTAFPYLRKFATDEEEDRAQAQEAAESVAEIDALDHAGMGGGGGEGQDKGGGKQTGHGTAPGSGTAT